MSWLAGGVLVVAVSVVLTPWAVRLTGDPTDRSTTSWGRTWPVLAGAGACALALPRGGVAMGLALFVTLVSVAFAVGALAQARRGSGWAGVCLALGLGVVAGAGVVLTLERAGFAVDRAPWLLLGVSAAHLAGAAWLVLALAWNRLGEPGPVQWALPVLPVAGAGLLIGWTADLTGLAVAGAVLLLAGLGVVTARALRQAGRTPQGGTPAKGRRRALTGTLIGPVGAVLVLAGALTGGFWPAAAGLALAGVGAAVALTGWATLLSAVSQECAPAQP